MANRFVSPEQQFSSNTGTPYAGGQLFFYVSGTSTPANTYQDQALTIPNSNPVVLDSAGYGGNIFLDPNVVYKVVLEDSNNNQIWTFDPVIPTDAPSNTFNPVISCTASGTNSITLTPITASQQPAAYSDYAVFAFVPSVSPTGAVTAQVGTLAFYPVYLANGVQAGQGAWTANAGPFFMAYGPNVAGASPGFLLLNPPPSTALLAPQGYLNLVGQASGDIIQTTDVVATTVYYSPFVGTSIPLYNGASFVNTSFSELSAALTTTGSPANTIQDVYIFLHNGSPTMAVGPSWSNVTAGSCSRGTGIGTAQITLLDGLWVNAVSISAYNGATSYTIAANQGTYVGSLYIDPAPGGQVTAHRTFGQGRKFGVWNAYNRIPIMMQAGDPTASWVYNTNVARVANGNSNNSIAIFTGLPEEQIHTSVGQVIELAVASSVGASAQAITGIGYNSTTAISSTESNLLYSWSGSSAAGWSSNGKASTEVIFQPSIGVNIIYPLENSVVSGGATVTYFGTSGNMLLSAMYRG